MDPRSVGLAQLCHQGPTFSVFLPLGLNLAGLLSSWLHGVVLLCSRPEGEGEGEVAFPPVNPSLLSGWHLLVAAVVAATRACQGLIRSTGISLSLGSEPFETYARLEEGWMLERTGRVASLGRKGENTYMLVWAGRAKSPVSVLVAGCVFLLVLKSLLYEQYQLFWILSVFKH